MVDYQAELARKTKEQADILAIRKAQMRGDLVLISDVAAAWADEVATVRGRLLALPATIASDVAGVAGAAAVVAGVVRGVVEAGEMVVVAVAAAGRRRPSVSGGRWWRRCVGWCPGWRGPCCGSCLRLVVCFNSHLLLIIVF